MKFKAIVFIRLRASVSDAAGNAVKANVSRVADLNCTSLRLGKVVDMEFECDNEELAHEEMYKLSDQLLANTVIEDWSYELVSINT